MPKSLQDAIDTTTPQGKFFFHITGAFAELERDLIRERTQAGLQAARARGRKGGRPKAIDDKTFQIALKLYQAKDMPVSQICQSLNINRRTFDRYMLKIKNV
jgi:DNA invertase Pin-like site-specific DNA recombinase